MEPNRRVPHSAAFKSKHSAGSGRSLHVGMFWLFDLPTVDVVLMVPVAVVLDEVKVVVVTTYRHL